MATFTYTFSDPANSNIVVTTNDAPSAVTINGTTYQGYVVTGISGTFNGETITGLLGPGGQLADDTFSGGGENAGPYDNTLFVDDTQGDGGSHDGLDGNGLGFTTTNAHYAVFSSGTTHSYESAGATHSVTLTSTDAPCFASGTLIRTQQGDVAVEHLRTGDVVVATSGEHCRVRWIGHGRIDFEQCPERQPERPVLICAGALGPDRPSHDLVVSPGHRICLDIVGEVLVAAIDLLNGATIRQLDVPEISYWHVELEKHDILLANGQPAESYEDVGNRPFFGVADGGADRFSSQRQVDPCRPLINDPYILRAIRRRITQRALELGWRIGAPDHDAFHFEVDGVTISHDLVDRAVRLCLPANAGEVCLVSKVVTAATVNGDIDPRRLGVGIRAIVIDDGLAHREEIAVDDARLDAGCFPVETHDAARFRWTKERLILPPETWKPCTGQFFLKLELAFAGAPRWVCPQAAAGAPVPSRHLRLAEAA